MVLLSTLCGCSNSLSPINGVFLHPGIGLSANVTTVGIARGQAQDVTLTVSRVEGFSGPVDLSVSGLAAGITATLTPPTVPADAQTAVLTLSASNTAALGNTAALVHAKGGNVADADLTITIVVNP